MFFYDSFCKKYILINQDYTNTMEKTKQIMIKQRHENLNIQFKKPTWIIEKHY